MKKHHAAIEDKISYENFKIDFVSSDKDVRSLYYDATEYDNADINGRNVNKRELMDSSRNNYSIKLDLNEDEVVHEQSNDKNATGFVLSPLVLAQGNLYNRSILSRIWASDVFYLSAIASKSRSDTNEVVVALNGWKGKINENKAMYCCFKEFLGSTKPMPPKIVYWDVPFIKVVKSTKFVCTLKQPAGMEGVFPTKVGLSHRKNCAGAKYVNVEKPFPKPKREDLTFGVCAKIIYGDYDAEKIFEWFQINKFMGVDHVTVFTYNVSSQIQKVLDYYHKEGFLTMKEFDFPLKSM